MYYTHMKQRSRDERERASSASSQDSTPNQVRRYPFLPSASSSANFRKLVEKRHIFQSLERVAFSTREENRDARPTQRQPHRSGEPRHRPRGRRSQSREQLASQVHHERLTDTPESGSPTTPNSNNRTYRRDATLMLRKADEGDGTTSYSSDSSAAGVQSADHGLKAREIPEAPHFEDTEFPYISGQWTSLQIGRAHV